MLIKTIEKIRSNSCCDICAGKVRILGIEDNLKDLNQVDNWFNKLDKSLSENNIETITYLIQRLFLEEIPEGILEMLIAVYYNSNDKNTLITDLKNSYVKRGIKGILFAWYPIINK